MDYNKESQKLPAFLFDMLEKQYSRQYVEKILDGYSVNRNVSIRINTIKSNVEEILDVLKKVNIEYELVKWSKDALVLKNVKECEIQTLEIYKEGKIYLQSLSSMLPPIVLNPKLNADILDMTAAPGSKTTQMAALSKNKAHITACEVNKIRAERLKYNIQKQGATCVYTMVKDARNIDSFFAFDQILLDAPCSGSGTLDINDSKSLGTFSLQLIEKSKKLQETLLRKAIEILKPGSEMVYSTCSILACENEDIITKVVDGKKCEVVPINLENADDIPILPSKIAGTMCVCPNKLYEGFFIAKIRKKFAQI